MRIMQHVIRIHSIKARVDRLNRSMKAACDAAGVEHSTVYRWLGEDPNPSLKTYEDACERLETWLDAQERELLTALSIQHAPALVRRAG